MKNTLFIFTLLFICCGTTVTSTPPKSSKLPPAIKTVVQAQSGSLVLSTSGSGQYGVVGETLPYPLLVIVTDSVTGNFVSGVSVTFIIDSLSVGSYVTDVNGEAGDVFTLGDTLGTYIISAAVEEDTAFFFLFALTLKETRKGLLIEIQKLADENIAFNAAQQSGVFKTVAMKRKNKKVKIGKVPNQAQVNELEGMIDDNLDEMVVIAARVKFLIP